MPVDAFVVNDVFSKALDYVNASKTPNDGGLTALAVETLREIANNDGRFNELFQQKVAARQAEVDAVRAANAKAGQP